MDEVKIFREMARRVVMVLLMMSGLAFTVAGGADGVGGAMEDTVESGSGGLVVVVDNVVCVAAAGVSEVLEFV